MKSEVVEVFAADTMVTGYMN